MFECVYTKDKVKKSKSWKDGFVAVNGSRIDLYDEERKKIYSFVYKFLSEEVVAPMYIIYCERLVKCDDNEEKDLDEKIYDDIKKNDDIKKVKRTNYVNKKVERVKNGSDFFEKKNDFRGKDDVERVKKGRSNEDILKILKNDD